MSSKSPRFMDPTAVVVDEAFSKRIRALIARVGAVAARKLLAVSEHTLNGARDCGRMRKETRDRIATSLDRIDAEAERAAE